MNSVVSQICFSSKTASWIAVLHCLARIMISRKVLEPMFLLSFLSGMNLILKLSVVKIWVSALLQVFEKRSFTCVLLLQRSFFCSRTKNELF